MSTDETQEHTTKRRARSTQDDELLRTLKAFQGLLPIGRQSIDAWAQHMVNLTDAVQLLLRWVTSEHDEP